MSELYQVILAAAASGGSAGLATVAMMRADLRWIKQRLVLHDQRIFELIKKK